VSNASDGLLVRIDVWSGLLTRCPPSRKIWINRLGELPRSLSNGSLLALVAPETREALA
jgi:hypothetical protein